MPQRPLPFVLLLLLLLLTACRSSGGSQSTCSQALNTGADYFLNTKLFANATKVSLPASIDLPQLSAIKIVNIRVVGLDKASRACNVELSSPIPGQLQLKACGSLQRLLLSFMLRAAGLTVDFVTATVNNVAASVAVTATVQPGGSVELKHLSIDFGKIHVQNSGFTGSILTKVLGFRRVKEQVRRTIESNARRQIEKQLESIRLPK